MEVPTHSNRVITKKANAGESFTFGEQNQPDDEACYEDDNDHGFEKPTEDEPTKYGNARRDKKPSDRSQRDEQSDNSSNNSSSSSSSNERSRSHSSNGSRLVVEEKTTTTTTTTTTSKRTLTTMDQSLSRCAEWPPGLSYLQKDRIVTIEKKRHEVDEEEEIVFTPEDVKDDFFDCHKEHNAEDSDFEFIKKTTSSSHLIESTTSTSFRGSRGAAGLRAAPDERRKRFKKRTISVAASCLILGACIVGIYFFVAGRRSNGGDNDSDNSNPGIQSFQEGGDNTVTATDNQSPPSAPNGSRSGSPGSSPSDAPTHAPSGAPSNAPSRSPPTNWSLDSSPAPSVVPSPAPSSSPSSDPSAVPSSNPAAVPSPSPSAAPSPSPSAAPSPSPTAAPSSRPTAAPSFSPSAAPSFSCDCPYEAAIADNTIITNCLPELVACGFKKYEIEICIKTSHVPGASTNDSVQASIKLAGGHVSDTLNLDDLLQNDFELGDFRCYGGLGGNIYSKTTDLKDTVEAVWLLLDGTDGVCFEMVEIRAREEDSGSSWTSHIYWNAYQYAGCQTFCGFFSGEKEGSCWWLDRDSCDGKHEMVLYVDHINEEPGDGSSPCDYFHQSDNAANDRKFWQQYSYIGCYPEGGEGQPRALDGWEDLTGDHGTPELCMNECVSRGFPYFGLQFHNECFCGRDYSKYGGRQPDSVCFTPCDMFPGISCGGFRRISVYNITNWIDFGSP